MNFIKFVGDGDASAGVVRHSSKSRRKQNFQLPEHSRGCGTPKTAGQTQHTNLVDCDACVHGFFSQRFLEKHMRTHHPQHICVVCRKFSREKMTLGSRVRAVQVTLLPSPHEKRGSVSGGSLESQPPSNGSRELADLARSFLPGGYICEMCLQDFKSAHNLRPNPDSTLKSFKCPDCEMCFETETSLSDHRRCHRRCHVVSDIADWMRGIDQTVTLVKMGGEIVQVVKNH